MAGAMVFGRIFSAFGGIMQAKAGFDEGMGQAQRFKFDSIIARRNAEMVKQDMLLAREQGIAERSNISRAEHELRGEGRVGYAAGNVRVDEGTPLEFDISAAEIAASERSRSRDDEAIRLARLETERRGLLAESRMMRSAAQRTRRGARVGAVGGVFSAIGGAMS